LDTEQAVDLDPNTITGIVAIDGPAGAGKSTVARQAAQRLGYAFLDTGAMYRAATWWALDQGIDLGDAQGLAEAVRRMPFEMSEADGRQRVLVGDRDVTTAIRSPEVTRCIDHLAPIAGVRAHLVALQRHVGAQGPTVAEGRDIGTVVFPKAKCKIYMTASLDERARRRARDLEAQGQTVDLNALREEIHARDEESLTREESPLRRAEDATLVDTTSMTLDEAVERVVELAQATR